MHVTRLTRFNNDARITDSNLYSLNGFPNGAQEDVSKVASKHPPEGLIEKLSALSQKYRFYEAKLVKTRQTLEQKIPDLRRALKAVRSIEEQSTRCGANSTSIQTHFELSDGMYVRASIPPTKSVCLWLGANVMVEYSYAEALELLTKNLDAAQTNLNGTRVDINYLRDQLNTTDVNMSRVYNYHVETVRAAGAKKAPTTVKASE